jgi:hypothetical protein
VFVLAGCVPQDFQHLGGACHAGGNECGVGRVQPVPADHLGVRRALRCQEVTLIVGVPAQLHIPHEPALPCCRVVMLVRAVIIYTRGRFRELGN